MPFVTKRQPLSLSAAGRGRLEDLRRSRSAEKRQLLHAVILLECASGMSDNAVAVANGVNRHTVALCIRKFLLRSAAEPRAGALLGSERSKFARTEPV